MIPHILIISDRLAGVSTPHDRFINSQQAHPSTPTLPPSLICGSARSWSEGQLDVGERGMCSSGACSRDVVWGCLVQTNHLRLLSPDESSEIINCVRWYLSYTDGISPMGRGRAPHILIISDRLADVSTPHDRFINSQQAHLLHTRRLPLSRRRSSADRHGHGPKDSST
jgi:hypothetical protein